MKFTAVIAIVLSWSISASAERVSDILKTRTLDQLAIVAREEKAARLEQRACELQKKASLPPTFCYEGKQNPAELLALDRACENLAAKSIHLPQVTKWTSLSCREAIARRSRDLAYAEGRDALR